MNSPKNIEMTPKILKGPNALVLPKATMKPWPASYKKLAGKTEDIVRPTLRWATVQELRQKKETMRRVEGVKW